MVALQNLKREALYVHSFTLSDHCDNVMDIHVAFIKDYEASGTTPPIVSNDSTLLQ